MTPLPWTPANAAENVLLKPHKLREPLSNAKAWRGLGAAAAEGREDGRQARVRQLDERPLPRGGARRVHRRRSSRSWRRQQRHTFQVLTKRPERMAELLGGAYFRLLWAARLGRGGLLDYAREHVERYGEDAQALAAARTSGLACRSRTATLRPPRRPAARDAGGGSVHQAPSRCSGRSSMTPASILSSTLVPLEMGPWVRLLGAA